MASAPPDPTAICPRCGAPNAPGTNFCATCGSPMAGAAPGSQPPGGGYYPPAPPPHAPPTAARAVSVPLPQQAAYDRAVQAVQALGGTIRVVQPPASFQYVRQFTNIWTTFGLKVTYQGQMLVTPDQLGGSIVTADVALDTGSAAPIIASSVGAGLMLMLLGFGTFGLVLGLASAGFSWWQLSSTTRNEQADAVLAAVQAGAPPLR